MKMIVCFLFHSREFARRLAEEILSYSSAVMFVVLARSYLTIAKDTLEKSCAHNFIKPSETFVFTYKSEQVFDKIW